MDIEKELAEAKQKRQEAVDKVNQLDAEKQALIQEALKLDGEVRVLERLAKGVDNS